MASPVNKVEDNFFRPISLSEVLSLGRREKLKHVVRIEDTMTEARAMCRTLSLATADRIRILGLLDVRLVLHVLKKSKDFEAGAPTTIDGIVKVRGMR